MQYKQNLWIWDERLKVGGGWSRSYEDLFCSQIEPNVWANCMQDIMAIFNFLDLNTNLFVSMYIIERILCNKSRSFLFEHFWKRKFWDFFLLLQIAKILERENFQDFVLFVESLQLMRGQSLVIRLETMHPVVYLIN